MPDRLARELAFRRGIGVRYGCHCAHLLVKHLLKVGHGLERFQRLLITLFPKINLPGILRISLGIENSKEDVDTLIHVLDNIAGNSNVTIDSTSAYDQKGTTLLTNGIVKQQMKDFVRDATHRVYSP